jgi:hypothetical protein
MEHLYELTPEQKVSKIASLGVLSAFAEAYGGNWDHGQWLELVDYVQKMGYAVPEHMLGLALENERVKLFAKIEKQERLDAHKLGVEETISFLESTDSFLASLERLKSVADKDMSTEHKKKLVELLSDKFTKEVRSRTEKGAWIPKKIVSDVEELKRKLV